MLETRTVVKIDWPAPIQSWQIGLNVHALCTCNKCMPRRSLAPLCGLVPPPTSIGVLGRPLTCAMCIAMLQNEKQRAKHR